MAHDGSERRDAAESGLLTKRAANSGSAARLGAVRPSPSIPTGRSSPAAAPDDQPEDRGQRRHRPTLSAATISSTPSSGVVPVRIGVAGAGGRAGAGAGGAGRAHNVFRADRRQAER